MASILPRNAGEESDDFAIRYSPRLKLPNPLLHCVAHATRSALNLIGGGTAT